MGLALSVRKNSGLARPKKKELAPFEIENRGASPIGQGQVFDEAKAYPKYLLTIRPRDA